MFVVLLVVSYPIVDTVLSIEETVPDPIATPLAADDTVWYPRLTDPAPETVLADPTTTPLAAVA